MSFSPRFTIAVELLAAHHEATIEYGNPNHINVWLAVADRALQLAKEVNGSPVTP